MKTINGNIQINTSNIHPPIKPQYRPRYKLSLLQKAAYDKLVHGLKAYSKEERLTMTEEEERTILYNQNYAWTLINRLKHAKMNMFLNRVLETVFAGQLCGNAASFLTAPVEDNNFITSTSLKEIEVDQLVIAQEFVKKGLLPKNFLSQ